MYVRISRQYFRIKKYFSLNESTLNLSQELENSSFKEVSEKLNDVMEKAIQRHLVADVSISSFLSGGIDSTLILSLMKKYTSKDIFSFTFGFEILPYHINIMNNIKKFIYYLKIKKLTQKHKIMNIKYFLFSYKRIKILIIQVFQDI